MGKIFETPLYKYQHSSDQDAGERSRHPVVIIGAGPAGLAAGIDLVQQGIPVVVVDDNDSVSTGSRAICFAKRPLEILDRLGCGAEMVDKGVIWNKGKVFFDDREIYNFDLQSKGGQKRPSFINLQQYYLEEYMVRRVFELQKSGHPIEIRGKNKLTAIGVHPSHVTLEIDTPEGAYNLDADWVIACDGANSAARQMLGLDFVGRIFEDNFLIADVVMQADFPTERWFWFDPPFNRGQSALLHKQPDNVWRIDLQLGWDIDKEVEKRPENVIPRLKAMLGENAKFELEWVSIYTFQCRRMESFRHGRVLFAGDSAHQVSPFGARGANSGLQDTENLAWKLRMVINGDAPETLMDTYNEERVFGADENIQNSSRSTDFITPKSDISKVFRDAVLNLAEKYEFARPLVNSGRLSVPCIYDGSSLNGPDDSKLPRITRPGASAIDAPVKGGWLLGQLGNRFQLLTIGLDIDAPDGLETIQLSPTESTEFAARYLGDQPAAIYLMRPDQHIAARWTSFDKAAISAALKTATGN